MELIWSQPGFKTCNQALYLENPVVRKHLGISEWDEPTASMPPRSSAAISSTRTGPRLHEPEPRPAVLPPDHTPDRLQGDPRTRRSDQLGARHVQRPRPVPRPASDRRDHLERALAHAALFLTSDFVVISARSSSRRPGASCRGTDLDRGVLSWCLQNAVALQEAAPDWAVVSYEQLVVDPDPVIRELTDKLALSDPERMRRRLGVPSVNVQFKSTEETRRLLNEGVPTRAPTSWRSGGRRSIVARKLGS